MRNLRISTAVVTFRQLLLKMAEDREGWEKTVSRQFEISKEKKWRLINKAGNAVEQKA